MCGARMGRQGTRKGVRRVLDLCRCIRASPIERRSLHKLLGVGGGAWAGSQRGGGAGAGAGAHAGAPTAVVIVSRSWGSGGEI